VIEKYIRKGWHFFELTPGFLATLPELQGCAERTLKRGRTEYRKTLHPEPGYPQQMIVEDGASPINDSRPKKRNQDPDSLKPDPQIASTVQERKILNETSKTGGSKRETWLPAKSKEKSGLSAKRKIREYLDTNPEASLNDLEEAFTEIKPSSLRTYYSLWKSQLKNKGREIPHSNQTKENGKTAEIIQALRNTVETQQKTIEALKSQNEMLKRRQNRFPPELKGFSEEEVRRIENVIHTFIRGMKNS